MAQSQLIADRILIVEDEPNIAEAVAYALQLEGFEAKVAADGRAVLDKFEEQPPDLVILDLVLPEISGWDLFGVLRRHRKVPVIMLTARVEEPDRVAGLGMGADDYVTEPFGMRELIARIRAVLLRPSGPQQVAASPGLCIAGVTVDTERARGNLRLVGGTTVWSR